MKRPRQGSTIKQYAYATRMMNGEATSKKEAALLSGFSMSVAENAKAKIENTEGFKNAMMILAARSNNLLVAVMNEFEARGMKGFSNPDLIKAMNAVTTAWDKIESRRAPNKMKTPEGNPLRAVFTKRVETQKVVVESIPPKDPASASSTVVRDAEFSEEAKEKKVEEVPDLDF